LFEAYTPYNQLELNIIESLDGVIQHIYFDLDELIEEHPEEEYMLIYVGGVSIELDCGNWLSMDSIGMN